MTVPATLFVIFNRPDTTAQVFEAIRQARPLRLYVASDGPRADVEGEADLCNEARKIATQIDWPCELKTLFRESNLGCGNAVSSAITWFFEQEEEGIILEDDCLPAPDFFPFCEELLGRYRDDQRIMAVCGSNYVSQRVAPNESYYFSYFPDIWGWATWRCSWNSYDRNLDRWTAYKHKRDSISLNNLAPWRFQYWQNNFDLTAQGKIDTWDYQWIFTVMESGGLACHPTQNLISNIGYRPDATHTKVTLDSEALPAIANLPLSSLSLPLCHPEVVVRNENLDRRFDLARFGLGPPPTLLKRGLNGVSSRVKQANFWLFRRFRERRSSVCATERNAQS